MHTMGMPVAVTSGAGMPWLALGSAGMPWLALGIRLNGCQAARLPTAMLANYDLCSPRLLH